MHEYSKSLPAYQSTSMKAPFFYGQRFGLDEPEELGLASTASCALGQQKKEQGHVTDVGHFYAVG